MGGGCRFIHNRETVYAGGKCENNCFSHHGGCNASDDIAAKQTETCERKTTEHNVMLLSLQEINETIEKHTRAGKSVFLYTPDLFSRFYFNGLFKQLPDRNGSTYIAVNAGVQSLSDVDFAEIKSKGIHEIWIGVESADPAIRDKYNKPQFTNDEVLRITREAKEHEINVCWYLVDGKEDTVESRLATYDLIKDGKPFRVNVEQLQ